MVRRVAGRAAFHVERNAWDSAKQWNSRVDSEAGTDSREGRQQRGRGGTAKRSGGRGSGEGQRSRTGTVGTGTGRRGAGQQSRTGRDGTGRDGRGEQDCVATVTATSTRGSVGQGSGGRVTRHFTGSVRVFGGTVYGRDRAGPGGRPGTDRGSLRTVPGIAPIEDGSLGGNTCRVVWAGQRGECS